MKKASTHGLVSAGEWGKLADILADPAAGSGGFLLDALKFRQSPEVLDLHPQTKRRIVAARRFIRQIEKDHPKLASSLLKEPYNAIEPIAKWYRYDQCAALSAAKMLVAGEYSVRALIEKEKTCRQRLPNRRPSAREWVQSAITTVGKHYPNHVLIPADSWAPSSVDAILQPIEQGYLQIMILALGPFDDVEMYERKRIDTLLIAAGLTSLGYGAVIALPKGVETRRFKAWLRHKNLSSILLITVPL